MKVLFLAGFILTDITQALASLVVSNNQDAGPGSLRQALSDARALGGGTITFQSVSGTINLQSSLPSLATNTIIHGPGAALLRVLAATTPVLTNTLGSTGYISGLTLTGSNGVVHNFGTLTLHECVITNGFTDAANGAGIANAGVLTLNRCTVAGNHASGLMAGIGIYNSGNLSMDSCSVTNNGGAMADGAGIYNSGTATLTGCTIAANQLTPGFTGGGGIFNSGTLDLRGCAITNNNVTFALGSGIYNDAGTVTLHGCTVAENGFAGGASGGGIYNAAGFVVLSDCSVTNNISISGGGIWNGGWVQILNSTVAGNKAHYSIGPIPGGGLYNLGTAILVNTTVSGNRSMSTGGGIHNLGRLLLLNSTIASNIVVFSEGTQEGGGVWNSGTASSQNSIFAGHTALQGPDFYGTLESEGNNLIENTNGCSLTGLIDGNLTGLNPRLGPLQDNGGATRTHALLPGSPAIDSGRASGAPSTDQRGLPRPQGLAVDIGAFEWAGTLPRFDTLALQQRTNYWLRVRGLPSTAYSLETSTNLTHWLSATSFTTGPNGLWEFVDNKVSSHPVRYFRVRSTTP